jgi:nucleoside-diphosphate-sugar epimerase
MPQRILLLGGHGFIGKSLMKELNKTPHEVIALSRRDGLGFVAQIGSCVGKER